LLELIDQIRTSIVISHATIGKAIHIGPLDCLALIDDDANATLQTHTGRQGDAQSFLCVPVSLDEDGRYNRSTVNVRAAVRTENVQAAIPADKAGIAQAKFHPR
jgi:hypothetical protein